MVDILGPWLPLIILIAVFALTARWQTRQYRNYLAQHTASTQEMVKAQNGAREAVERQTAALERIAIALEKSRER